MIRHRHVWTPADDREGEVCAICGEWRRYRDTIGTSPSSVDPASRISTR